MSMHSSLYETKSPSSHYFCASSISVLIQEEEHRSSRILRRIWDQYHLYLILSPLVVYSIIAFSLDFKRARFLFVIEMTFLILFIVSYFLNMPMGLSLTANVWNQVSIFFEDRYHCKVTIGSLAAVAICIILWCAYDDYSRLISLFGLVAIIGGSYLSSWHRQHISWRPVLWGFGLQFFFALLILRMPYAYEAFDFLGDSMTTLLTYTQAGSGFVFGYLVTGLDVKDTAIVPVFAFAVLPTVIFFSSLVSILYYYGILQYLIQKISYVMAATLGTSASESLNAASNIFIGQTEAPLLIKPFLPDMTKSEMHAVMTGGFATIAGGVLAIVRASQYLFS